MKNEDVLVKETSGSHEQRFLFDQHVFDSRYVMGNLFLRVHYADAEKNDYQSIWRMDVSDGTHAELFALGRKNPILNADVIRKQDDTMHQEMLWCPTPNQGFAVVKDLYEYRIDIYDNNSGKIRKSITRDFKLPKKSKAEIASGEAEAREYEKLMRKRNVKFKVLKEKSIIRNEYYNTQGMFYDDRDRLWVLTNEPVKMHGKEFANSSFDIFNRDGKYIYKIPIQTSRSARMFRFKNGHLYYVGRGEDGYCWLYKMRIQES